MPQYKLDGVNEICLNIGLENEPYEMLGVPTTSWAFQVAPQHLCRAR